MTKASIQQFSTTNTSNTDVAGINVNTGWPPSNVGPAFRELMALLASAMVPLVLDIAGETSVTLTAAQASAQLIQFTGALTADCIVTIPNALFSGIAQNNTTGGFNVILAAGVGQTATIQPGPALNFYEAGGGGSVILAPLSAAPGTSGNEMVNFSQFAPNLSLGHTLFPGGLVMNWGVAASATNGLVNVPFNQAFTTGNAFPVCTVFTPGFSVCVIAANEFSFNAVTFNTTTGAIGGSIGFYWMAIGF